MDKLWLHPNWMLSSNKKEHITDKQNLDVPQDIVLNEKANLKRMCTGWFHVCNNHEMNYLCRDREWSGGLMVARR